MGDAGGDLEALTTSVVGMTPNINVCRSMTGGDAFYVATIASQH